MENKKHEIEDIAWEVFQQKTGLRFRKELTPGQKLSITSVEDYQYYRDEAVKICEKKLRALDNKKYPEIIVPASGPGDWGEGAYCLCFVYSKYKGNFVLKGYYREVKEYLKKNYTHYFYNMSLWNKGFSRDIWGFWKKDIGIFEASIRERKKGKKTQVRPYSSSYEKRYTDEEIKEKTFYFKRLPKRWIPEFDGL